MPAASRAATTPPGHLSSLKAPASAESVFEAAVASLAESRTGCISAGVPVDVSTHIPDLRVSRAEHVCVPLCWCRSLPMWKALRTVSFRVRIPPLLPKPPGSEPQLWELCPKAPHTAVLLRRAPQNAACYTLLLTSAVQPAGTSVPVPLRSNR